MGYRIELWTEHEDNGAAIHALASRVGEDTLTLTSGEEVPNGEWVAFEVKLADGTVFLEGMGRCQGAVQNDPLWDIELGMLQLDTRDEMLFERIQLAAEDLASGGRPTGEVDISKLDAQKDPSSDPPPAVGVELPRLTGLPQSKPPPPPLPPPVASAKPPPIATPPSAKPPPIAKPAKTAARPSARPSAPPAPKKKWPWQKTTEPGMPSPEPIEAPAAKPAAAKPAASPPPLTPKSAPAAEEAAVEETAASPAPFNADPPIPPILRQRLMNIVPTLVAEGRIRDLSDAFELALRVGIQALETLLEEED